MVPLSFAPVMLAEFVPSVAVPVQPPGATVAFTVVIVGPADENVWSGIDFRASRNVCTGVVVSLVFCTQSSLSVGAKPALPPLRRQCAELPAPAVTVIVAALAGDGLIRRPAEPSART